MLQGDTQENWQTRQMPANANPFAEPEDRLFFFQQYINEVKRDYRHVSSANQILMRANKIQCDGSSECNYDIKLKESVVFTVHTFKQKSRDDIKNIDEIIEVACDMFNVTLSDLRSAKRTEFLASVRMIVILYCRWFVDLASTDMGAMLSRDHSTILHSVQKACELLEIQDERFTPMFNKFNATISQNLRIDFTKDKPYYDQFQERIEQRLKSKNQVR